MNELIQLQASTQLDASQIDSIVRAVPGGAESIQDIYPLTPLQEGMLFSHVLNEHEDRYTLSTLLELRSRAQLQSLIEALQSSINRHDVLRTAVFWRQLPQPVQVVCSRALLLVEELVLDAHPDPVGELRRRTTAPRQWDLQKAPLVRLEVASNAHDSKWYALLSIHHVICDHTSSKILVAEVLAHLRGQAGTLPEPLPYCAHVLRVLARSATPDSEAFFLGRLSDVVEVTAPFGLRDVDRRSARVVEHRSVVEPTLSERIRSEARRFDVGAARLFHAAWGLLVARLSNRTDVLFGTVLGTRAEDVGVQRAIGLFINTLPLRLQLAEITAAELLRLVHRQLIDLLKYRDTSLVVAQACTGVEAPAPLFSSLLNYRHAPQVISDWSSADIRVLAQGEAHANYPLALTVDDLGEEFVLIAHTDGRVDPARITGYMHVALQSLVQALAQAPDTPALLLDILPESEKQQLIKGFNATYAPYPRGRLLHELFEEQARRTPDAIAVEYEGRSLTYDALNSSADQLGWYLKQKGVGPDCLVGIFVDRSLDMVVGLLGILKAGGAYVPLDRTYPVERLRCMLEDARLRWLLTQERLKPVLPAFAGEMITLDSDWHDIAQHPSANLDKAELGLCADHLAYAIFTSGSAGRPKAVMVEHRSVVNLIQWGCETLQQMQPRRCSALLNLAFDASVLEIWSTLSIGASLVVAPAQLMGNPAALLQWWVSQSLDASILPTPLADSAFAQAMSNPTLKLLLVGGDKLRGLPPASSSVRLINNYGPTETTVVATSGVVSRDDAVLHIGRPIANTQVRILDRQQQLVPISVEGEIHVGGAGVARGYLNNPALTAERFAADPFSVDPAQRMYRTGDLARWRADGTVEFLGRNDRQVKVRGYRVELAEIEHHLASCNGVGEAIVVGREDESGEMRLVAYITAAAATLDRKTLRCELERKLPAHMVPAIYVQVEALPFTPNGKFDYGKLPAPRRDDYDCRPYEAPMSRKETVIAEIWQELLQVERVGRHDNFFELGGQSLLAMRLLERMRRRNLHADVKVLFGASSLLELAQTTDEMLEVRL